MKRRSYSKYSKEPTIYCNNPKCDNVGSKFCYIEEKVVEEIQKIKEVKIGEEKNSTEKDNQDNQNEISKTDIKNIKDFLIEEYEVNEKCLEIN